MPVLSRSSGSVSSSRPDPPGNSVENRRSKCSLHVGERALEDRDDLAVDGADHAGELAAARLHVLELLLQEPVALLERVVLLERERVDRPHEPQLAVELARAPGERRAFGHRGRGGVERDSRLDVVLGAQPLDRGLEAQPRLGVVDLGALRALADLGELALERAALGAQGVELFGRRARRFRLAPTLFAQPPVQLAGARSRRRRAARRARRTRAPRATSPARWRSACACSSRSRAASRASTTARRSLIIVRRCSSASSSVARARAASSAARARSTRAAASDARGLGLAACATASSNAAWVTVARVVRRCATARRRRGGRRRRVSTHEIGLRRARARARCASRRRRAPCRRACARARAAGPARAC